MTDHHRTNGASVVQATAKTPAAGGTETVKIAVKSLYKIFGDDPQTAMAAVRAGATKTELLDDSGHVLGLDDVSIDMVEGEITVIMGLSGSGKSTLIRCLNRLIEPTSGAVLVDGENILDADDATLRQIRQKRMSMVFQKFALLPHRTVLENAALAPAIQGLAAETYEAEARQWLERVGLTGFEDNYPKQLSGGMQQRVGIARALTSNADVMLMDEAFSALDPLIRTDMQNLLLELQRELRKTIVFITHDLDEALKLADHLVILKDGRIAQQGEPQEILLRPAQGYVTDFVSDVNRARVLRVRSVMTRGAPNGAAVAGEIDHNATLESVIADADGDVSLSFRVQRDGAPVGVLHMRDLVRALAPSVTRSENSPDRPAA